MLDNAVIVLFTKLANANNWEEIEISAKPNEEFLKQYMALKHGIIPITRSNPPHKIMCGGYFESNF